VLITVQETVEVNSIRPAQMQRFWQLAVDGRIDAVVLQALLQNPERFVKEDTLERMIAESCLDFSSDIYVEANYPLDERTDFDVYELGLVVFDPDEMVTTEKLEAHMRAEDLERADIKDLVDYSRKRRDDPKGSSIIVAMGTVTEEAGDNSIPAYACLVRDEDDPELRGLIEASPDEDGYWCNEACFLVRRRKKQ